MLVVELAVPAPDTDFQAHRLWARQLISTGSISISDDGRWDDCSIYYPNTVPKPAELVQLLAGELAGGGVAHAFIRIALAFAAASLAARAALRASGSARTSVLAGLAFGLNPAFVGLCRAGSPSVPFLALLMVEAWPATLAACLVRPEAFIYSAARAVARRKWLILPALLPLAAVWPLLNLWMAGNPLWSVLEVRYAVRAMPYETPGALGFWLWAAARALLVMGPLLLAALVARPRGWPWLAGGVGHLAFLSASLLVGSLALPRYVDQIFLLAIPWAVASGAKMRLPRWLPRPAAAGLALCGAMTLWPSALSAMGRDHRLQEGLEAAGRRGWEGRLAANELLIPAIALSAGMDDPRSRFVALDRMVFEGASPSSLGVGLILLAPGTEYLPERTALWLESHAGIPIDTVEAAR